jgi:uncharacterized DUF497 family protein
MTLTFEWHDAKARSNKSKHGVSFETACLAFSDPYYTILRRCELNGEERLHIAALTPGKLLFVVFTWRGQNIRLISAREATRHEFIRYWKDHYLHVRS